MTDTPTHSDLEDRLRSHYKVDAGRVRPRPLELDEVLRLAERATDGTRQRRQQPVEGLAPLIVERQIETARRWPRRHLITASAVAAAVVGIAVGGLVIATRDDDPTRQVAATQPATVVQPPVEFTACVSAGGDEGPATVEQWDLPDGETSIARSTQTWQLTVTDVSDPRLDGTWNATAVNDRYSGPGSDRLIIGTWTHRIENADGAWQGSHQTIDFPDGQVEGGFEGLYVMIGEGAYEGLTAFTVISVSEASEADCPNTRGYIAPSE